MKPKSAQPMVVCDSYRLGQNKAASLAISAQAAFESCQTRKSESGACIPLRHQSRLHSIALGCRDCEEGVALNIYTHVQGLERSCSCCAIQRL